MYQITFCRYYHLAALGMRHILHILNAINFIAIAAATVSIMRNICVTTEHSQKARYWQRVAHILLILTHSTP